jgi:hypothetical protein
MTRIRLGVGLAILGLSALIAAAALAAVSGTTEMVPGTLDLQGVACPSKGACIGVGETPRDPKTNVSTGVFVTISGGEPGSAETVPGTSILNRVACPNDSYCIAVGYSFGAGGNHAFFTEIKNGEPGPLKPLGINGVASIGCGSATSCWVLGDDFPASPTGPSSYHPEVVHLVSGKVDKVYSPSGSFEFSAGEAGGAAPVCSSDTTCIAVGTTSFAPNASGAIFSLENGTVTVTHTVPQTSSLSGLDCTSSTSCTIVGDKNGSTTTGYVMTLSSGKLGAPETAQAGIYSLACESAAACYSFGSTVANQSAQPVVVPIANGEPAPPQNVASFVTADTCHGEACLGVGDAGQYPNQQGAVFSFKG